MGQQAIMDGPASRQSAQALVGRSGCIGGVGQGYVVIDAVDDTFAMIHTKRTDEHIKYRIADIERDGSATVGIERFESLVGEHRSIGPDGPTYLILAIVDPQHARMCILESDREVLYLIEDILLDPGPEAAWKNR